MSFTRLCGLLFLCSLWSLQVTGITFESSEGKVRATEGEEVLWENTHDRRGNFRDPQKPGHMTSLIEMGEDTLCYGIGLSIFMVSTDTGQVKKRISLPGLCKSLANVDGQVEVKVEFSAPDSEPWEETYRVGEDVNTVPFFLPTGFPGAFMPRHDAESALNSQKKAAADIHQDSEDEADEQSDSETELSDSAIIQELVRLQKWDATNPWYAYWRGMYLNESGMPEEAKSSFQEVFAIDKAYDYELLPMTLVLDDISPDMGVEAFSRGMHHLVHHGYDPEMTSTLLTVVVQFGRLGSLNLDTQKDLDRLNQLGDRLWDFAPFSEWSVGMYQGLADANREAGRDDQTAKWEKRTKEAFPYRHFGFGSRWADAAGHAINVLIAGWIALILVLIVKLLRYLPAQMRTPSRWKWNPLCVWTRGEIAGFLVVQLLLVTAWVITHRGITFIGNSAALPLSSVSGNFGHPESVAYLKRFTNTAEGRFVYALALQKANRLDEAAELYRDLDWAQAKNNLGVILHQQGDLAGAENLFKEALAKDPDFPEAAHNLGKQVDDSRINRLQKYGLSTPIYAMPTSQQWAQALTGKFRTVFLSQTFEVSNQLGDAAANKSIARASIPTSELLTGIFFLLLAGCAILGIIFKADAAPMSPKPKRNLLGWALGFVIPGTARQLSILGAPLLTLAIFSWMAWTMMGNSDGMATNILDAISMPHLEKSYGVWTMVFTPLERAVRLMLNWWWIIWILNLVVVGCLEGLWPDPWGPRAKKISND